MAAAHLRVPEETRDRLQALVDRLNEKGGPGVHFTLGSLVDRLERDYGLDLERRVEGALKQEPEEVVAG